MNKPDDVSRQTWHRLEVASLRLANAVPAPCNYEEVLAALLEVFFLARGAAEGEVGQHVSTYHVFDGIRPPVRSGDAT